MLASHCVRPAVPSAMSVGVSRAHLLGVVGDAEPVKVTVGGTVTLDEAVDERL